MPDTRRLLSPKLRTFVLFLAGPIVLVVGLVATPWWIGVFAEGGSATHAGAPTFDSVRAYLTPLLDQVGWVMGLAGPAMLFALGSIYVLGLRPVETQQRQHRDLVVTIGRVTAVLCVGYAAGCGLAVTDPVSQLAVVVLIVVFVVLFVALAVELDSLYIGDPEARERAARKHLWATKASARRMAYAAPARWWHPAVAWLTPSVIAMIPTVGLIVGFDRRDWSVALPLAAVLYLAVCFFGALAGVISSRFDSRAVMVGANIFAVFWLGLLEVPLAFTAMDKKSPEARDLLLGIVVVAVLLTMFVLIPLERSTPLRWLSPRWAGSWLVLTLFRLGVEVAEVDLAEITRRRDEVESWGRVVVR